MSRISRRPTGLSMPSLGTFDGGQPHERCKVCRRCVLCSSLQCGSKPSKKLCKRHRKRKS